MKLDNGDIIRVGLVQWVDWGKMRMKVMLGNNSVVLGLKKCCSFPPDRGIEKGDLIQIWVVGPPMFRSAREITFFEPYDYD
jgi:hypothetical protein